MMSAKLMQEPQRLSSLLAGWAEVSAVDDRPISGLALDGRAVRPGFLFLACTGARRHGLDHLEQALGRGAVAVACEPDERWTQERIRDLAAVTGTPLLAVAQLGQQASRIAARFYADPSRRLEVIGITGTNGKTSCSQFLAQALADRRCAVIGTLGNGFPGALRSSAHTTPDAVTLQAELSELSRQGAAVVAMEVSSHALAQGRVSGVHFATAVLTNLSRDHLDYHGDMAAYRIAKQRLFQAPGLGAQLLNLDDPFGRELLLTAGPGQRLIGYGLGPRPDLPAALSGWVWAEEISSTPQGMRIQVRSSWGDGELLSGLLGRFNAANLMAVLGVLLARGLPFAEALDRLGRLETVAGRMERFGGPGQPTVIVDYAHTPDALEQTLRALRAHCKGRLSCVFGCGGDRDRGKRPLMGAVAEEYCDAVVLTDDNPRSEEGGRIIAEILGGCGRPAQVQVERNRARAIRLAIEQAGVGDLVLVAGKGHETVQQVGDLRLPFSDREQVGQLLDHPRGGG